MGSLDASKTTKASDVNNGGHDPLPGHYMTLIKDVKWNEKLECEVVECQVLGGTTPNQSGCEIALFLKRNDEGEFTDRHLRFALASELILPGQVAENVDFDFFCKAKDRYLVVRMEEWKKDDKKGVGVGGYGLDMWSPCDPEVAEIVAHMDGKASAVMQRLCNAGPGSSPSPQQTAPQQPSAGNAQQPATAGAAANGSSDGWDV